METLVSHGYFRLSASHPLRFNPLSPKYPTIFYSSHRNHRRNWRSVVVFCLVSDSSGPIQSHYGGWDEFELLDESGRPGKLDSIRDMLASVGINDRRHGFLFLLGFLSALAVSRVRASSMVVLPISVLVFVAGFAVGVARASIFGSSIEYIGINGGVSEKKVSDLGALLKDLEVKILDLGNGFKGDSGSDQLGVSKMEHLRTKIGHARGVLQALNGGDLLDEHPGFDLQGGKKLNQKSGRKKRDLGMIGNDLVQYFSSLIQDSLTGLRPPKGKDSSYKREVTEEEASAVENRKFSNNVMKEASVANENDKSPAPSINLDDSNVEETNESSRTAEGHVQEKDGSVNVLSGGDTEGMMDRTKSYNSRDGRSSNYMLSYDEEPESLNSSLRFMSKQGSYRKMVFKHRYGQTMQNDKHYSADPNSTRKATKNMKFFTESEKSSLLEQTLDICDRSYLHLHRSNGEELKVKRTGSKGFKDEKVKSEDQSLHESLDAKAESNVPSSSTISADEEFTQNMKEASELLKRARECMLSQADEETADAVLYKSARLLSTAVAMKPVSLMAVGQLGNTYLLHGELKLKISRELRALLSRSDAFLGEYRRGLRFKKLDTHFLSREKVTIVLTDVCEECEDLLIEAGRKYRMALSIDGNDIRALYNWGLALSFRAQLIADIGPEAAVDADKMYMAAIDKFDAMMSRSNFYSSDALYRWGVALQQRSHLRSRNSREKIKLLQQAKSLFEDVLCVESDNQPVREALSSCISELGYNGQW